MVNQNTVNDIIQWIKDYYQANSFAKGCVVGISGGKDSMVVAKLCAMALGEDKILGVIMPNGEMADILDAIDTCKILNIKYTTIDINNTYNSILENITSIVKEYNRPLSSVTTINTAPRIRMTTLYAIAGSLDYMVANTSNLSEYEIGYTTKWGDNVGDFAPIANFTKSEVCEIGLLLGLPDTLVNKAPSDGLSGKSDEDKIGFKYSSLDTFIRTGVKSAEHDKITKMHLSSEHKRIGAIKYKNDLKNYFDGE